jgi:hypothetical protein
MPYHMTCDCGRLLVVPESQRDDEIHCPGCGQLLPKGAQPPLPSPAPLANPTASPHPAEEAAWTRNFAQQRYARAMPLFAAALLCIVLVSLWPLMVELWRLQLADSPDRLERWAYLLMALATLQVAYAIYLFQLPDWSSTCLVSAVMLLVATGYATLLGVRFMDRDANPLTGWLEMDGNRFSTGQEAGWCLIMLLLTATFAFFAGRYGAAWHRRESQ